jgi:hypothetical protein
LYMQLRPPPGITIQILNFSFCYYNKMDKI